MLPGALFWTKPWTISSLHHLQREHRGGVLGGGEVKVLDRAIVFQDGEVADRLFTDHDGSHHPRAVHAQLGEWRELRGAVLLDDFLHPIGHARILEDFCRSKLFFHALGGGEQLEKAVLDDSWPAQQMAERDHQGINPIAVEDHPRETAVNGGDALQITAEIFGSQPTTRRFGGGRSTSRRNGLGGLFTKDSRHSRNPSHSFSPCLAEDRWAGKIGSPGQRDPKHIAVILGAVCCCQPYPGKPSWGNGLSAE